MDGARTLILNGLAQNDVDMANHRLLNLDTSNLPPLGIPPTIHPAANNWLHDWDSATSQWTATQPDFVHLSGSLTNAQQSSITRLGTIMAGVWQASVIGASYLPALNLLRSPLDNVSFAGHRLTNVGDPVSATDAVNKGFMDLLLLGLNPKEAVRCATTEDVALSTLDRTVDGVTLNAGDRVLVKNQNSARDYENGIYVAATGAWTRATDADAFAELNRAYCVVLEGTVNINTSWVQTNTLNGIGIGHPVHFAIFSNNTAIIAGVGLQKIGSTISAVGTTDRISIGSGIDIANNYAGQNSIVTLGTITTGTWHGTLLSPAYGGTGVSNASYTISLVGNLGFSLMGGAPPGTPVSFGVQGDTTINLPLTGTLSTLDGDETFTNKRVIPRSLVISSSSKPSINSDALDVFMAKQLSENILSMTDNLTGTPVLGQSLIVWLRDNGISRLITWGTKFAASTDLPLPVSTTPGKWLYLTFTWNSELVQFVLTNKLNNI